MLLPLPPEGMRILLLRGVLVLPVLETLEMEQLLLLLLLLLLHLVAMLLLCVRPGGEGPRGCLRRAWHRLPQPCLPH